MPAHLSVLAEFLSVVGGHHPEGVVVKAKRPEQSHEGSEGAVRRANLRVVGVHDVLAVARLEGALFRG